MARKHGKKQNENPIGCTGEGKSINIREGSRESKTGTVLGLSFEEVKPSSYCTPPQIVGK